MIKRNKLWMRISAVTFAGVASIGVTGCDAQQTNNTDPVQKTEQAVSNLATTPSDMSLTEGEGEGASGDINLATDDIAYLTQLALMRGHLFVGNELYKAGHFDHAKMHMKHPKSELYADVEPAFVARGSSGFSEQLSSLSESVEGQLGSEAVTSAYEILVSAIAENESVVSTETLQPAMQLKLISEILRVAGEEYAIAVIDGEMKNAHEYQDALGFTTIATVIANFIESTDIDVLVAKKSALKILNGLKPHWPSLIPPESLDTEASAIYVAAAKIELLSLGL